MNREDMNRLIDEVRDALVDDFADLIKMLNERKYEDAALFAYGLSVGLGTISSGLAAEALVRRFDKSE